MNLDRIDRQVRRVDKMLPDGGGGPQTVTPIFYDPDEGTPDTEDVEGTAVLFPTDVPEPDGA